MMNNRFDDGVDAAIKVALATLQQTLEDILGPLDPHTVALDIYETFEQELLGRV